MEFVRFESPMPNERGAHIGVFGLARVNVLSTADREWLAASNAWGDAADADPATVDPTIFDKSGHPLATCWFRQPAEHLLAVVRGYLDLLDRYDAAWRERRSADPGERIYEDDVQIVVAPY
jgi:hypothetical protein